MTGRASRPAGFDSRSSFFRSRVVSLRAIRDGAQSGPSVPPPAVRARFVVDFARSPGVPVCIPLVYDGVMHLVFWGDLDRKFRAFDAESGRILWEAALGGTIQNSTITYAVNGKQYVAVLTGEGLTTGSLLTAAQIKPVRRHNALYVFALP